MTNDCEETSSLLNKPLEQFKYGEAAVGSSAEKFTIESRRIRDARKILDQCELINGREFAQAQTACKCHQMVGGFLDSVCVLCGYSDL